ncbi:rho-associated protein kinase 2-like [Aricia agestis]|uniref:rho-associated protein kinase 2-like n=1 Tax=Aricia agestis TaxID=91739 RepID=UPI001C208945|nr:rho-associated protein kinase 2-like [Aricia agestis]
MEKIPPSIEHFINTWNAEFQNYPLTAIDLKKPQTLMGALFQVFDRFGIDRDAVLAPPPEESQNQHTIYYWDLLPIINMTRVFNHLVSVMPQNVDFTISINYFLQPSYTTSHSLLMFMFNMMLFYEDRLRNLEPLETSLFAKTDEVKALNDEKNRLLEMLNQQAEEKAKRSERLEKLDSEIAQIEEEIKQEKEAVDADKQELETVQKERAELEHVLEQKKGQRDALLAEIEKKEALRVYDADDIQAKVEQAKKDCQEAEEKLNSLRATLLQKENSLINLQNIKPSLETANNLLSEIEKLTDSIRDYETGDLESDSAEGELDVLITEVNELEAQLSEIRAARADAAAKRLENEAKREQDRAMAESCLKESEEKEKKNRELSKHAIQRVQEIKQATVKYEQERVEGFEQLANIRQTFIAELDAFEDALRKKALESKEKIEERLKQR